MTGISLLTTDGDAYACGLAHGRRFAREIADNVATYLRRFAASGLHRDAAFAEAARWRKAIAAHNGAYAEEMQGIADGSGQGEDIIALLNARYELAFMLFGQEARSERVAELAEVAPDGCTTFGLLPEVTTDRHTWLGQNWDWLEGVHGRTFVLRARRKGNRASCASPKPGSPAGKWVSTNAASASSKMASPRAMMAAIRTKTRFTCAAERCWMRSASMRRRGR
jgi:isopenicillin-N N-acyltransferase-like protein